MSLALYFRVFYDIRVDNTIDFSDEPNSHVFGSLSNGVFHGKIVTANDGAWFVEKSHYYFPKRERNDTEHSVIYHEADVDDPYEQVRTGKQLNPYESQLFDVKTLRKCRMAV